MELRHLRYFLAVAEARHFSRAAEQLHIAQPPLSQAVRRLEAELGVELFTRTTRQVDLTPAGEVFARDAQAVLDQLDGAVQRAREYGEGRQGLLRIGLCGSASYGQLPRLAGLIERELPGVALDIHTEMLTPAQEDALLEGRIDVGVLRPPLRSEELTHRVIGREPLVLAMPDRHRLVGDASAGVADLRHDLFITYASSSIVNDAVVRTCRNAGFYPRKGQAVGETSTMLALVAAGLGVALVPASAQAARIDGVTFAQLPGTESVDLAMAWRSDDPSPLVVRLLECAQGAGLFASHPDEAVS